MTLLATAALAAILFLVIAPCSVAVGGEGQISYVLEPFEDVDPQWVLFDSGEGSINASSTTDAIISGTRALKLDYEVIKHKRWGGNVVFSALGDRKTTFSCEGATHISLWYKVLEPQSLPKSSYMRFILFDSSDCDQESCRVTKNLEWYYSFQHILDDTESVWKELKIGLQGNTSEFSPFWQTGFNGRAGNRNLDLSHIMGFRFNVQMHWDIEEDGASSTGTIMFDQLACVGGGDLISASLRKSTKSDGIENDDSASYRGLDVQWHEFVDNEQIFNPFAERNFDRFAQNGSRGMVDVAFPQYALQESNMWNGELAILHEAPNSAYYNLSQATGISFDFDYQPGLLIQESRADVQLSLLGGLSGASSTDYSILNAAFSEPTGSTRSFTRSFIDEPLDNHSDLARVKGFKLAVKLQSERVSGLQSIAVGAIRADMPSVEEAVDNSTAQCVSEPGIYLGNHKDPNVTSYPFAASECCELCERDPECKFGLIRHGSCYLTSAVKPHQVALQGNSRQRLTYSMFWTDDISKRGDFCDKCECRESDLTIDCRGYDLSILPKTFGLSNDPTQRPMWRPRVLDLRENKRLTIIGTNALESIRDSIQELRLPKQLRYISEKEMSRLSRHLSVIFEATDKGGDSLEQGGNQLVNAVTRSDDQAFFGAFCCGLGQNFPLASHEDGITFCNVTVDSPGIDAYLRPFWRYDRLGWFQEITPDAPMFSEAAESVQKCAQYCTIIRECTYFQFDQTVDRSSFTCTLIRGTDLEKIEEDTHSFAGPNSTLPKRISGVPPKSRHEVDGAAVLVDQQSIVLKEGNGFETNITFSLGSMPIRGGVWIKPGLDPSTTFNLNVTFNPPRVALFDNHSKATISIAVLNGDSLSKKKTLVILSEIQACDQAFIQSNTKSIVYADVEPTELNLVLVISLVSVAMVVFSLGTVWMIIYCKRKQADSVWLVKRSELLFSDPPEVAGRGTFGLVLLAEYRGTVVAVKRVIPPKPRPTSSHSKTGADRRSHFLEECDRSSSVTEQMEVRTGSSSVKPKPGYAPWRMRKLYDSDGILSDLSPPEYDSTIRRLSGSVGMSRGTPWSKLKEDFIAEMRVLSSLRHPCITTVMGAVIGRREEPMLIMEFMDHGSLFDLLQNDTLLLEGEILLPILRDVAQGMRFLHAATPQVIHADLKAQNVLVDSKFRAKVADFGLSQKKQVRGAVGTPFWMAPELLRRTTKPTAKCDVYSFGIMLYEVYSRQEPYAGEDPKEVLRQVADPEINKRPPCPAVCPAQVECLMNDCLVADPEKRPGFEELDQRLKRANASSLDPGELLHSLQQLKKEKLALRRSNELLYEVFPEHVAKALSEGRKVEPQQREVVTIFFSDIVGFTQISSSMSPMKVSRMLDRLYSKFDALSRVHDVFKVETIGDAYMAVTNLVKEQTDHAKRIAEFAIAAIEAAQQTLIDEDDPSRGTIRIRAGFDSGSVVANVVGSVNPRYCLFGDTVNTASRMESTSQKNRIQCSERAAIMLYNQAPDIHVLSRGVVTVKGKGEMSTYWVDEGAPFGSPCRKVSGASSKTTPVVHKAMFRRKSMV